MDFGIVDGVEIRVRNVCHVTDSFGLS
jgi:hypothetical protein